MRWLALILCLLPALARAQVAATLVADRVQVTADQRLIAEGHVEVLYDGTRLSAERIVYDQADDRLSIEGPILIVAADGSILTADRASLDPRLENGILLGARLVLERQLQLAANQIDRVGGRYTQLSRVAATSCNVCAGGPPLWEIRAQRVIHDQVERQLYFENAQVRVAGLPILWLPRMRLPDPTLKRASGLLVPQVFSSDTLGTGLRLPYFIAFGDARDLTVTPTLSGRTRSLGLAWREATRRGGYSAEGALTRDAILPGETRGYVFANGSFDAGNAWTLAFKLEGATDKSYLLDYGISDQDRLQTSITGTRVTADSLTVADLSFYQTLRDPSAEVNASLPRTVLELRHERLFYLPGIGGVATLGGELAGLYRKPFTDGIEGRDELRLSGFADWKRSWVLPAGIVAEAEGRIDTSVYAISQDSAYGTPVGRTSPSVGARLRWPLIRQGPGKVTQILEPVITVAWSDLYGGDVPNEDSTRSEFDEGNLLSLDHFPGEDRIETGPRAILGVSWSAASRDGWSTRLGFGRVFRDAAVADFSASSGLSGRVSDWLIAGQIDLPRGFGLDARAILKDNFGLAKSEARVNWQNEIVSLRAAYVWLPADPAEDRPGALSEWTLDSTFRIDEVWSVGLDGRYDVAAGQPTRAGLQIGWQNECVTVQLSVSRRYTSSTTVQPSTDIGLTVGLNGFSAGRSGQAVRATCAN